MFDDRTEAGRALATRLAGVVQPPCVVAAIPRGGVAVALPVVERLGVPLTVVYARKLTAAVAPELAFGAVDEDGQETLDPVIVAGLQLSRDDVAAAHRRVLGEIRRRMELYGVPPLAGYLPGRSVVLVDDGLATGLTMQAAVGYARRHGARDITIAVPCASARAIGRFEGRVDGLVSLIVDERFLSVGQHYRSFAPVADEEVKAMLARAAQWAAGAAPEVSAMLDTPRGPVAAALLLPRGPGPHPAVILGAHGEDATAAEDRAIAEAARCEGIAVLLLPAARPSPDAAAGADRGRGSEASDVIAAAGWLRSRAEVDSARLGLAGTGSAAGEALCAAARDPRFRALVLRTPSPEVELLPLPRLAAPALFLVGEHDEAGRRTVEVLAARLGGPHRTEVIKHVVNARLDEPAALDQAATATVRWLRQHLAAGA